MQLAPDWIYTNTVHICADKYSDYKITQSVSFSLVQIMLIHALYAAYTSYNVLAKSRRQYCTQSASRSGNPQYPNAGIPTLYGGEDVKYRAPQ